MRYRLPLLGIQEIDEQHAHLISCLERLELWVAKGHGFAAALDAFVILNDYVAQHFHDEESIFRDAGYPLLDQHITEHQKICAAVAGLYQQVLDGGDVTEDLLGMMRQWLITHIGVDDLEFARFVEQRRQGGTWQSANLLGKATGHFREATSPRT